MALMALLSFRFSKLKRLRAGDRITLMFACGCFLGSLAGFFVKEPKFLALVVAVVENLALLLERFVVRQHDMNREAEADGAQY